MKIRKIERGRWVEVVEKTKNNHEENIIEKKAEYQRFSSEKQKGLIRGGKYVIEAELIDGSSHKGN